MDLYARLDAGITKYNGGTSMGFGPILNFGIYFIIYVQNARVQYWMLHGRAHLSHHSTRGMRWWVGVFASAGDGGSRAY